MHTQSLLWPCQHLTSVLTSTTGRCCTDQELQPHHYHTTRAHTIDVLISGHPQYSLT